MANALYDSARELFLTGLLNWSSSGGTVAGLSIPSSSQTFRVVMVDTGSGGYTVNTATHTSLADIPATPRSWTSPVSLTGRTTTGGAADANDVTFNSVSASAPTLDAIVIYLDGASDPERKLIAYIDTAAGLPIQPNGGDIIITWDNGANKIFKL